ncbi:hypothetical protein HETIRDRAFT_331608, partial [Heterobasidion irregulare TC 32-1]
IIKYTNKGDIVHITIVPLEYTIQLQFYTFQIQIMYIINCSFNNLKSQRSFPRLLDKEEWNDGLNCMCNTKVDDIADKSSTRAIQECPTVGRL